jgi:hypothetical protein
MDVHADTRGTRPSSRVGAATENPLQGTPAPGILFVDDNGNANTLDLLH